MPGNTNVVRPDGTVVQATPEETRVLGTLGYTPETEEERTGRLAEAAAREFYTGGGQRLLAGAEGLASGATLGLSNFALDSERSRERARFNPGTRLAGELVGAIAPGLLTGGAATPAGALTRGTTVLAQRAATGRVARGAIQAGLEGGVVAGGTAAGHAHLAGDPVTAESVLAAAGWGALFGAGVGAAAGGLERGAERLRSALVSSKSAGRATGSVLPDEAFSPLAGAVRELRGQLDDAVRVADDAVAAAGKQVRAAGRAEEAGTGQLVRLRASQDEILSTAAETGVRGPSLGQVRGQVLRAYKAASRAVEDGNPAKMTAALEDYRSSLTAANQQLGFGFEVPALGSLPAEAAAGATSASARAVEDVTALRGAARHLGEFPTRPEEFLRMTSARAERTFGALDQALARGGPELEPLRGALGATVDRLEAATGIATEGQVVDRLRQSWTALRAARIEGSVSRSGSRAPGGPSFLSKVLRQASARKASQAARHAGAGAFSSSAAYQGAGMAIAGLTGGHFGLGILAEVAGVRAGVQRVLRDGVAKYGPAAARGARAVAPKAFPLSVRLDGSEDTGGGDQQAHFRRRAAEIAAAAPVARDVLFRSVMPLQEEGHGDLAAALHEAASRQLEALVELTPKDPGTQFTVRGSLWDPDDVELLRFSRVYEAFQDPLGVAARALEEGDISPDAARALERFSPGLYQELRTEMTARLASEPEFTESLGYEDQANLSVLLDLDLHSTFRPEWIAAQQAMFTERNQPTTKPGPSGSPGRPPGPAGNPAGATAAQALTER